MKSRLNSFGLLSRLGIFLLILGVFSGCHMINPDSSSDGSMGVGPASGQPSVTPTVAVSGSSEVVGSPDLLHRGDRVTLVFSDIQSTPPPPYEEQIREDGRISPPLIGPVDAAGKTAGQLQTEIQALYVPKYFRRLSVTVRAEERFIFVGGQVKLPGKLLYSGEMTVLKAIKAAGDFTDFAQPKRVEVIRTNNRRQIVNCDKARRSPKLDLPIFPGDMINVPRRYL